MRVLLINKNAENAKEMSSALGEHFIVDVALSYDEGVSLSQTNEYDALVIDSPNLDSQEEYFCYTARQNEITSPILVLSDSVCPKTNMNLLLKGADWIFPKTSEIRDLSTFISVATKRSQKYKYDIELKIGHLVLNTLTKEVRWKKEIIELTRKEYSILEYFLLNRGRVLTKEQILEHSWEEGICTGSNTLEVHIKSLRDKIDRRYGVEIIKTYHGLGYRVSR